MKYKLVVRSAAGWALTAMIFACPSSLQAGWGILHGGSSGGSAGFSSYGGSSGYATYSSVGGSSGYSSVGGGSSGYAAYSSVGGSSGVPGPLHRLASRIRTHIEAKHARRAAYASSGGSSGYVAGRASYGGGSSGYTSYSSYGGSSGYSTYSSSGGGSSGYSSVGYGSTGYRSSYGSTGGVSYGSTGGASSGYGSVGSYYGASAGQDTSAMSSLVSNVQAHQDAVYLTVAVPDRAKVFVNDNPTSSTGAVRKFVSRGLKPGKEYRFQVRAELEAANGQILTEEKTLVVTGGAREQVQFAFADSDSPVETAITLSLPADAKVVLAGSETKAVGNTRTFRTNRLKPGESWDDYTIEVHYDGQVKSRAVRLIGGDNLQLTFDFTESSDKLAAR